MIEDAGTVVDSRGCVFGTMKPSVVDAPITPFPPRGHPQPLFIGGLMLKSWLHLMAKERTDALAKKISVDFPRTL